MRGVPLAALPPWLVFVFVFGSGSGSGPSRITLYVSFKLAFTRPNEVPPDVAVLKRRRMRHAHEQCSLSFILSVSPPILLINAVLFSPLPQAPTQLDFIEWVVGVNGGGRGGRERSAPPPPVDSCTQYPNCIFFCFFCSLERSLLVVAMIALNPIL